MQLTQRIPFRTERSRRPKRTARTQEPRSGRPAEDSRPTRDQARAGAPEDRATYYCACGYVFQAPVTTTVGCPHCGAHLAW